MGAAALTDAGLLSDVHIYSSALVHSFDDVHIRGHKQSWTGIAVNLRCLEAASGTVAHEWHSGLVCCCPISWVLSLQRQRTPQPLLTCWTAVLLGLQPKCRSVARPDWPLSVVVRAGSAAISVWHLHTSLLRGTVPHSFLASLHSFHSLHHALTGPAATATCAWQGPPEQRVLLPCAACAT
jgi:hypothetical protein